MSPRDTALLFLLFLFTGGLCHAEEIQNDQTVDPQLTSGRFHSVKEL